MTRMGSSCIGMRGRAQRGAIGVLGALLLVTVVVGALVSIDVGHVFYRQRELQKVADMAALAGAQQLKQAAPSATVSANVLAATQAAGTQNGYGGAAAAGCASPAAGVADGMNVCMGVWDPAYTSGSDTARHFKADSSGQPESVNAVQVVVTQTVPILFVIPGGTSRQLRAEAIANASPPVASFSLGSGLLDVNTATGLLGALLGPNVAVQLSAVDWSGLVGSQITLEKLRVAAGVGTIEQLLDLSLSLRDFDALVLKAANQDGLLSAALGSPPTTLGVGGIGTAIHLAELLNVDAQAPAASSAAEVGLNVATLLLLGAQVARGDAAVALDLKGLTLPLGIASVTSSLQVIQPPQLAAGPVRRTGGSPPWATTASTGQLNVDLTVEASPLNFAGGLVEIVVQLPLRVQAASATGALTKIQCAADPAQRRATVDVAASVANVCLAKPGGSGCASVADTLQLGRVKVLGLSLLSLTGSVNTAAGSPASSTSMTLAPGDRAATSAASPVTNLVGGILNSLTLNLSVLGLPISLQTPQVISQLLTPVTSIVDSILGTLLPNLGIRLGNADLWMHDIDCNNAELVF